MSRHPTDHDEIGVRARMPAVAATLLAPLIIYWICRTAAFALPGAAAAFAGTALPPTDYSATLRGLFGISQSPQIRVSRDMVRTAELGAISMPLAFEPFFVAARAEEQAGNLDRAVLLMEEARRRRSHHTGVRAQLLEYYGRKLNYPAFLTEIDYVLRRNEAAQHHLLPEMARLIALPAGREALAQMLAREPNWRGPFFFIAGEQKVDADDALKLLALISAKKPGGDMMPEERFYVQSLLSAGQFGRAREAWARPIGAEADDNLVFDGEFRGSTAPPPFNWVLQDADVGRATIAGTGNGESGLDVEYFGGKNIVLAEQMLALRPGQYQFELVARSDGNLNSGRLYWRIACLPNNEELRIAELNQSASNATSQQEDFVVPAAGCGGQRLQLVAEAGDVASTVSVRVSKLGIRRSG